MRATERGRDVARVSGLSLLSASLPVRLGIVAVALSGLWLAVFWALR